MAKALSCLTSLAISLLACQSPSAFVDGRLVDLTHAFDARTLYWPTAPGFELTSDFEGTPEGAWGDEAATRRTWSQK